MSEHRWVCSRCATPFPATGVRYDCPDCGGRLDLDLAPGAPRLREAERTMWRYADLLPVDPDASAELQGFRTGFAPGGTPLTEVAYPAAGGARLWVKDETVNPTGSLKDRASAAVVASALRWDQRVVATASTGNAAASLAAAAQCAGLRCVVFVPRSIDPRRVYRLQTYGAEVMVVDGDYDTANRLCSEACAKWQWYSRTTAMNPHTTQGKKTVALEIAEQLDWQVPDAVVLPVGDGNILVGAYHGFRDAHRLGWTTRVPRLLGVQAEGAAPIHQAWLNGDDAHTPMRASTVAAGISVGDPMDGRRALAAIRASGGALVTVGDHEILSTQRTLAAQGIGAETASAAGFAGLPELRAQGHLDPGARAVVVNTGNGDTGVCPARFLPPEPVAPHLRAVELRLESAN